MAANLTPRGEAILRTARAFFAALDDFRAKSPDEARLITAFVISHVRSSDASVMLPSVDLPVVASPVVAVEPKQWVARDLADGADYEINTNDGVMVFHLHDGDDLACVALTEDQAAQLQADVAAVRAWGAKR
jgi:hypothetical protein